MVRGQFRSRTFRRVYKRTPGGRNVLHYVKRKPKQPHCADCSKLLHGIPRLFPIQARNTAKSKKRPERPFGGKLCSSCTRKHIAQKARV